MPPGRQVLLNSILAFPSRWQWLNIRWGPELLEPADSLTRDCQSRGWGERNKKEASPLADVPACILTAALSAQTGGGGWRVLAPSCNVLGSCDRGRAVVA